MNIDKDIFLKNIEQLLNQKNKVSGDVKLYISNDLNKVLVNAEDEAKRMGDSYVSVEHLMLALIAAPNRAIKQLFKTYGINRESFLSVLATVRGNRQLHQTIQRQLTIHSISTLRIWYKEQPTASLIQ